MGDLGEFTDATTIRFDRLVPAAAERVWDYLTDGARMAEWFGGGEISNEVGGRIELRLAGSIIRGNVLAREMPKHLSYSWIVYLPGMNTPVASEAILNFDLARVGEETTLTLTQSPIDSQYRSRTAASWHALLDILRATLAAKAPPDFMETFQRVHPEYENLVRGL